MKPLLLHPINWKDYSLVDSGDGKKLERFGNFLFISDRIYFSNALSKLVTGSKLFFNFDLLLTIKPDLDLIL